MANRAYLSVWAKGFTEDTMLERLEQFLQTIPFSAERPGIGELVIRALAPTEAPIIERDLRGLPLAPAELVEMAREYQHADSSYEICVSWDLWTYDPGRTRWELGPHELWIACHGEEFDGGVFAEAGHFQADLGFEHLFTGHARLLGIHAERSASAHHPAEADFLSLMTRPENLCEYHEKTRANIQKLLSWLHRIEKELPLDRYRLWSEGEENFEARLDEILAVR